jgi:putative membrane protein
MLEKIKSLSKSDLMIAYLCIIYAVGITGILLPLHPDFILLTPLNLMISLVFMLWFHPQWSAKTWFFLAFSFFAGLAAEIFGVNTGLLFGTYSYGDVLGWKIWNTPLIIGVNWMLLSYSTGTTANVLFPKMHWIGRGIAAAIMMVVLDVLIEPAAIQLGFWSWPEGAPPLQNFLGWFGVALPILLIFAYSQGEIRNKVGVALLVLQFLFFAIIDITSIK